jgi:Fe-S-cluster formation regulator IscX/YfhJ
MSPMNTHVQIAHLKLFNKRKQESNEKVVELVVHAS